MEQQQRSSAAAAAVHCGLSSSRHRKQAVARVRSTNDRLVSTYTYCTAYVQPHAPINRSAAAAAAAALVCSGCSSTLRAWRQQTQETGCSTRTPDQRSVAYYYYHEWVQQRQTREGIRLALELFATAGRRQAMYCSMCGLP